MIPYRDTNPTELVPFVNWFFIAANVGVWFLVQGAGDPGALQASVVSYGMRPCELTFACPREGLRFSSLVTSMFMHGGWGHLLGNLLFLWVFGNNIEDSMGHLRYVGFYLLAGVLAALVHVFFAAASQVPTVGASGAIAGVMGAYILLYPTTRIHTWVPPIFFLRLPAFLLLGYWIFVQVWMGMAALDPAEQARGGVAFWAHVGGFAAGLLLIKLFERPELTRAKRSQRKLSRREVARLEW